MDGFSQVYEERGHAMLEGKRLKDKELVQLRCPDGHLETGKINIVERVEHHRCHNDSWTEEYHEAFLTVSYHGISVDINLECEDVRRLTQLEIDELALLEGMGVK